MIKYFKIKSVFLLLILFFLCYFLINIYIDKKYEQAIVLLKYGNVSESINKLEYISTFSGEAKNMLFEIHIDKRFNINHPEKAYSYLDNLNKNNKRKIIVIALKYYDLNSNSRFFWKKNYMNYQINR